ncbi:MAG: hypothetical protein U0572_15830 [Phycisphaerales bacterium]
MSLVATESHRACPECGWDQEQAPPVRPRWCSPWRLAPAVLVFALIAQFAWINRSGPKTQTASWSSTPEIVESPPITREAIVAVAEGRANEASIDAFRRSLRSACAGRPLDARRLPEERSRFVEVGFVATERTLREDFEIGWPIALLWGVRMREVQDSVARMPASSPNDRPFLWFPPWPDRGGDFTGAPSVLFYTTNRGEWSLRPDELRFSESDRRTPATPMMSSAPKREVALQFRAWSIPIAAMWIVWALAGRWTRGLRRVAVVAAIAVACTIVFALAPTFRTLENRDWQIMPPGGSQRWKDLAPLDAHTRDLLAALNDSAATEALARRILDRAPVAADEGPKYLAMAIGPTWSRDVTTLQLAEYIRVIGLWRSDDAPYIPSDVAAQPRGGRFAYSLSRGSLLLIYRPRTASTQLLTARIDLGWVVWIGLAVSVALTAPANVVTAIRRRRVRRRTLAGCCVRCGYQLQRAA